jgi:hypothetical protein
VLPNRLLLNNRPVADGWRFVMGKILGVDVECSILSGLQLALGVEDVIEVLLLPFFRRC